YRWDDDNGCYDDEERQVWEAIAIYKSGVDPNTADIDKITRAVWDTKEVRYMAEGFRAQTIPYSDSVWERRAAWLAKMGKEPGANEPSEVKRYFKKTKRVWERWMAMES